MSSIVNWAKLFGTYAIIKEPDKKKPLFDKNDGTEYAKWLKNLLNVCGMTRILVNFQNLNSR